MTPASHFSKWPFSVLLCLLASGCMSFKPAQDHVRYYVLAPINETPVRRTVAPAHLVFRLSPVDVASYLQNEQIPVRAETNDLSYSLDNRWAEPLEAGVRRVLAEDLRSNPSVRDALIDQFTPPDSSVDTISIRVFACEGVRDRNQGGGFAFEVAWRISGPGALVKAGIFRGKSRAWSPGDFSQLANDISRCLLELSDTLVAAILESQNREGGASASP